MNKETRRSAIILAILLLVVLVLSVSAGVAKEAQFAATAGSQEASQDVGSAQPDQPSQSKYQLKQATATMVQSLDRDESGTFIIRLNDPPVATYKGGVTGFAPTSPSATGAQKLDPNSPESLAYQEYLVEQQAQLIEKVNQVTGRNVEVSHQYHLAINGLAAELTVDEALAVAEIPEVSSVIPDWVETIQTDAGPTWIGADTIWDGSATGLATQGEGIIVGIVDTGINMDHPSFADVGDDGYDHTNPAGAGNYFGWCDPAHPDYDPSLVCNDKLIGAWSGDADGPEDANGHGTHTASTAAGNVISDVVVHAPTISVTFPAISGVAPHANIIAYNIEGTPGSGSASGAVIIAATEQAIADGVDVINYSFGAGGGDPWVQAQHWFSVREAGIFVATSAGNAGPDPDTVGSPGNAPWMLTVGASSHDRKISNVLMNLTGGTSSPAAIQGEGITGGYGPAAIVYAGDVDPGNVGCDLPYTPGTFSGEIVVCDYNLGPQYGGRVNKSINLANGGAGGFILINNPDWGPALMVDSYALPGMGIPFADGEALKTWLADGGSGHMGTIRGYQIESAPGDIMAGFSSRGPNGPVPDVIKPDVTAPGRRILAAVNTTGSSVPPEFDVFQGTSMSSPHVAGAGALMRALYPSWTPAEIQSALMSTGIVSGVLKHDGLTQADPFDMGAGRVNLYNAARTGLVLDETPANLWASDPSTGGDPKTLNLASLANAKCVGTCTWTRIFQSTLGIPQTWDISASSSDGLVISTDPISFTITASGSQAVTITVDASGAGTDVWKFGEVTLTPSGSTPVGAATDLNGLTPPDVHLPVAVVPTSGNLPDLVTIETRRDTGSQLIEDLEAIEITDLTVNTYGLVQGTQQLLSLSEDPSNGDPYDNLNDGTTQYFNLTVPAGAKRLVAETFDSEAPDMDLFVGTGSTPSAATEVCASTTATAIEYCNLSNPAAGTWWILVQNWAESGSPPDQITLSYGVVSGDAGNMTVQGPASNPAQQLFNLRVFWDEEDMEAGDRWYGKFAVGSDAGNPGNIGATDVNLIRHQDDVAKWADPHVGLPGDTYTYTITVQPNITPEELNYTLTDTIPAGLTYVSGSVTATSGIANVVGDTLTWTGTMALPESTYNVETSVTDPVGCIAPLANSGAYVDLEGYGVFPDSGIFGDTIWFTVNFAGGEFNFFGEDQGEIINITDDGFTFFNPSSPGSTPWAHEPIPTVDDPNNLMAIFWRDMEVVYDGPSNSGVTLANLTTGGVPSAGVIEYDDVQDWPANGGPTYDFEVIVYYEPDPSRYEVIFAYDNLGGSVITGTIGLEDKSGLEGVQYAHDDIAVTDGMAVCFDLVAVGFDPVEITYAVTADAGSLGPYSNEVLSITDNPGDAEAATHVDVFVGLLKYMPVIFTE